MAAVQVLVFSDFTSPFCHVTEAALRLLEDEGSAAPRYAAFELYPSPAPLPPAAAADEVAAARPLAEALGVAMAVPPRVPRTRKAHEAFRFAEGKGVGREMREAVFGAYFAAGRDVGRVDVLVELAGDIGLDAAEARVVLGLDTFAGAVEADRALARRLGIDAVPAMVVGGGSDAELVLGAHALAALREMLERRQA